MTTSHIDQAVALRCIDLVGILVDRGARIDNTLHYAVDDYAIVQFLLSRGAKILSVPDKISAITNAAGVGNVEVIRLLISHANDAKLDGSREALNWAASRGRVDAAKCLMEHGFDVNATKKGCIVGETP